MVVNGILEGLKIDAPPGIPLRARTGVNGQGSTKPPSLTDMSGIFTGTMYSPQFISKAAARNVPNDSMVGRDRRQVGAHLLSVSVKRHGIWNEQDVIAGVKVAIERNMRLETQFSSTQGVSQQPSSVSRGVEDHRMIWQSENRISRQRPVSGGLFLQGHNEANIWAPQMGEYPSNGWFTRQRNQIASRTSLRW
ncbi:hypothetical protein EDD18DRAFT_1163849 [Armillaria luteobubalina]|uniref:Uncharacterized protein n=1 Tax=Armillaria luteobubalina TaxID=153913 RepID=A0AA39UPC9_9AGAR|nr:hypothetical protein EDD18DRAFT_1163849 [Armillaria luteobubalina]